MQIAPFPLHWPDGWDRTPPAKIGRASFDRDLTNHPAVQGLFEELRRLGAHRIVVSSNVPLRQDGLMRSDKGEPVDRGVAVYFQLGSEQRVMACDRWDRVCHNIRAITRTIKAQRGIARWGVGTVDRAFAAYAALPPPGAGQVATTATPLRPWWEVLGVFPSAPIEVVEAAYRALAKSAHPDAGGTAERMAELTAAIDAARAGGR